MSIISEWQKQLDQNKGHSLEANFLITTPMFIGDGRQKADSIRPPSIKGALRFWWRALYWHQFMGQAQSNESMALKALHAAEADLFGSITTDQGAVQSRFSLVITRLEKNQQNTLWRPGKGSGVKYLMGQGVSSNDPEDFITEGSSFDLILSGKPGATGPTSTQWVELEQTLLLWGLLGGLGSRARKGLGSVSLQSINGGEASMPRNKDEYFAQLKGLLSPSTSLTKLPPFTALSCHIHLGCCDEGSSPMKLIETVGLTMQRYRSVDEGVNPGNRSVFGLPHKDFVATGQHPPRRASPLFSHIHQLPNGDCLAMQLLMPAQFLPPETRVDEGVIDWKVIKRYLDSQFSRENTLFDAKESTSGN
jgi:CRISPR-associated protein Cmr1